MNNPLGVRPSKGNQGTSVRPRSSVGRVTVDLIGGQGFDFHRSQKMFSLPRVRPRSSVGRVTVDLIGGHGFDFHRSQKIFSLRPCGSLADPFTRANWVIHGFN